MATVPLVAAAKAAAWTRATEMDPPPGCLYVVERLEAVLGVLLVTTGFPIESLPDEIVCGVASIVLHRVVEHKVPQAACLCGLSLASAATAHAARS